MNLWAKYFFRSVIVQIKTPLLQLFVMFSSQGQLEGYKSENERLRYGETTALTTMRHNAQVASEYLNKAAQDAETSIKYD